MDSVNPTRRDWFRLRLPRENRMLGESNNSANTHAMQTIAHPPNHDGMDLSQLPPMREALLTGEQVANLFTDVGILATEVQLMQRSQGSAKATAAQAQTIEQLELARNALMSGVIPRLQVRYRWLNALWIDTLTSSSEGFKLIRIQHTSK